MRICETERLVIREFEMHDVSSLYALNSCTDIMQFIPGKPSASVEEAEKILREVILEDYRQHGFGRWAVEHKQNGEVIGFCGPKYLPDFDKVELGYRYFKPYWGKGIGYEAASAVLAVMPDYCHCQDVIALIDPDNMGSAKLAQKLHMHVMGMSELLGRPMQIYHKWL